MDKKYTLDFEKPLRGLIKQLEALNQLSEENAIDVSSEIKAIEAKIEQTKRSVYSNLSSWQRVQLARHPLRPYSLDYVDAIFDDFQELSGDRQFRDDKSIIGGTAFLDGRAVMIIAQQKGRNTKENILRNFGMPNPEGYRKALRLMKLADKFGLPIVTWVDTPGAYPGVGSEERHVAEAIAVNIREMSRLTVPIITIIVGEGGSGGALGIAVADRVLILENAYYSVISPESCSAILWKDRSQSSKAAEALRLGDQKMLKQFGVVDDVIEEPMGGAQNDPQEAANSVQKAIRSQLKELVKLSKEQLVENRYARFRAIGEVDDGKVIDLSEAAS
ncbi:MAG: acetyl-CoA carboxylase carboxyl transferase subunit alpha [Opitutaceae bacterium]|nr:acetyl-CoA carboxylase carboxyl transferase subunit alpha [Opitutaceae bacterium]|tara:strand:- start:117 stop:1112 length:996 start_codon:yes stop_codon:yes gene_type:complete